MTETEFLVLLRAVNCPLLTFALIGLVLEVNDVLPQLKVGWRIVLVGFGVLLIGGIVGSAIKYYTGVPVDWSVAIVTLAGLLVLGGLVVAHHFNR